jgi:hypothetical protein
MTKTLYELALQGLQTGAPIVEWLFHLDPDFDGLALDCLQATVRTLLHRDDLAPRHLAALAKLMLGLKRLPLVTPGLNVRLTLSTEGEVESRWWDVHLTEDQFAVEWTGWVTGPFGSDSISGEPFEAEPGQAPCGSLWEQEWLSELPGIAEWADVEIEDESQDSELDWEHDDCRVFVQALMRDEDDQADGEDEEDERDEEDEWDDALRDPSKSLASLVDLERARREPTFANPSERCDLCSVRLADDEYFIDGAVKGAGTWANMCPQCHLERGEGIGWGFGQLFMRQEDGSWLMVAGFRPDDPDERAG